MLHLLRPCLKSTQSRIVVPPDNINRRLWSTLAANITARTTTATAVAAAAATQTPARDTLRKFSDVACTVSPKSCRRGLDNSGQIRAISPFFFSTRRIQAGIGLFFLPKSASTNATNTRRSHSHSMAQMSAKLQHHTVPPLRPASPGPLSADFARQAIEKQQKNNYHSSSLKMVTNSVNKTALHPGGVE